MMLLSLFGLTHALLLQFPTWPVDEWHSSNEGMQSR